MPEGFAGVWRDFMALHSTRPVGMNGPSRIPWAELDAYQRVNGFRFQPWQIEAIRRADMAFMEFSAETAPKPKG